MRDSTLSEYQSDGDGQPDDKRDQPDGYKDAETLRNLYWGEELSTVEIADHFDVGNSTIYRQMSENGIDTRSRRESSELRWGNRNQPDLTESLLRELFVEKRLSMSTIAEKTGYSFPTVGRRLDEHDIERRSRSEAAEVRHSHEPASFCLTSDGYERWSVGADGENQSVIVHRLAAVAWFGFDAVCGNVVHHKNKHKRDNREENLRVMTDSEHARLHNENGDIY